DGGHDEQHQQVSVIAQKSGAVFGIDLDVVVAEVAGPDTTGAVACAKVDADIDVALRHHRRPTGFGVIRRHAALGDDLYGVQPDIHPAHVQGGNRGTPYRRQDAAP